MRTLPTPDLTMTVGGIVTSRLTRADLVELMIEDCRRSRRGELRVPRIMAYSNGSVIAAYHRDRAFRESLAAADMIDPDGVPLVMATRLLCKRPLPERVTNTDFVHDASTAAVVHGIRFYFLGAKPGVAHKAAAMLIASHPGLQIVGVRHGYFQPDEESAICQSIVEAGTDVLWLGLGSPRQEEFAIRNRERLAGVSWVRSCGGLFDFHSGHQRRAPRWMQQLGLEWLFRCMQEPTRLARRYITTNPVAMYYLATQTHD